MIQLKPTNLWAVSVPLDNDTVYLVDVADFKTGDIITYKVLGTVTADTIDFDPSPHMMSVCNETLKRTFYHDYREGLTCPSHPYRDGKQSLRSLLHNHNVWGENNLVKKLLILKEV